MVHLLEVFISQRLSLVIRKCGNLTPLLEINENTLSVFTPHEMKGYDHYIIKHIVLDNRFNIISEKVFDPSKETPISKHNIIGYEDKLYVLSICNNHDTWVDIIKIKP